MMKRLFFSNISLNMRRSVLAISLSLLGGSILLNGCQPPSVGYQVQQFAQLRIMNFAENCNVPIDVYWNVDGQTPDTLANVYKLAYGQASVYYTSLPTGANGTVYHIYARQTGQKAASLLKQDITLQPGQKYTWIFSHTQANNNTDYTSELVADEPQQTSNSTFIRFINMQPNAGTLALHVNDPSGTEIGSGGQAYLAYTPYVALTTALDTTYTLFVTPEGASSIVSRLSDQTFAPGSYYTVVYSGDLCLTQLNNLADTVNDKSDTLRIRVFDDNISGADQSNPPAPSFRFNIVNGYIPTSVAYGPVPDTALGFVVNGQTFPEHANFTLNPVGAFGVASAFTDVAGGDNGATDVYFQSTALPSPLDIKAYVTDPSSPGSIYRLLVDFNAPLTTAGGKPLVSDASYSIVIADTVPANPPAGVSTAKDIFTIPVPDQSDPTAAKFVFVAGQTPTKGQITTKNYAVFWYDINGGGDNPVPGINKGESGSQTGLGYDSTVSISMSGPTQITIKDSVGSLSVSGNRVPAADNGKTFTAVPGGIYEVVLLGQKGTDGSGLKTLILRVNPKK
ncbi:MAG TPA: DUF4397 domain-containing protein [Candidatus Kapabacteria bacterium]|jgi:hypothetical protein|nr:DUF4397 domain-containing protein [Candidatus Kapabacteria bacterium]